MIAGALDIKEDGNEGVLRRMSYDEKDLTLLMYVNKTFRKLRLEISKSAGLFYFGKFVIMPLNN